MQEMGRPAAPIGQREWRVIGASLKSVFAIDDNRSFEALLKALDNPRGPRRGEAA